MAIDSDTVPQHLCADELRQGLDAAVRNGNGDPHRVVPAVRTVLAEFVRRHAGQVPDEFAEAPDDRYARRLMHRSDELGYAVIAMTWGAGQRTPIHDHCGMWCVEGVWQGCIEVEQYECMERKDEFCRFEPRGCMQACAGSAGSLIPPHEYHTIANAEDDRAAITVHVYADHMTTCNIFEPAANIAENGEWYRRLPRQLHLD
ncbi:MAG: cysteine dioxygenase family protein [Pseudomonadota bacterium]